MTHFAQWQITDSSIVNEYFACIDFHTALGNASIQFNKICVSLFISLQCCYHNAIANVITFNFLRAGWNWEVRETCCEVYFYRIKNLECLFIYTS